jgi:hypothetical protein
VKLQVPFSVAQRTHDVVDVGADAVWAIENGAMNKPLSSNALCTGVKDADKRFKLVP